MIKVLQKIILVVAVITVTAHSIFPHFHLDEIIAFVEDHHHHEQPGSHHHDDAENSKENQKSLFSFAQLDDDFIPANDQPKNVELPAEYLATFIVAYVSNRFPVNTKTQFGWYIEYPPPDNHCYNLPSRAPPAVI